MNGSQSGEGQYQESSTHSRTIKFSIVDRTCDYPMGVITSVVKRLPTMDHGLSSIVSNLANSTNFINFAFS
jgi:hypothetical protein